MSLVVFALPTARCRSAAHPAAGPRSRAGRARDHAAPTL